MTRLETDKDEPVAEGGSTTLSAFITGPLIHSPQGKACLASCAVSIAAGLIWVAVPEWRQMPAMRAGDFLFVWPFMLLLVFMGIWIRRASNLGDFDTGLMLFGGALPFVFPYVSDYCRANPTATLCIVLSW